MAELWRAVETATAAVGVTPAMAQLAWAVAALASRDSGTEAAVTDWLRRHTPPTVSRDDANPDRTNPDRTDSNRTDSDRADSDRTNADRTNAIGGAAVIHGPAVQARDIHGGIHVHHSAPQDRPRPPAPRQFPPVRRQLVDRESDVRALDALRAQHPPHTHQLLVVSGFAGVGKTTLVSRWLRDQADSFPDGQLYADLGGHATGGEAGEGREGGETREAGGPVVRPVRPTAVLEGFLHALGAASVPADLAQRIALWRSLTADLRLGVFLDNAYTAAQVRPLLFGSATGLTVVTSRNHLTGLLVDGAALHRLGTLTTESAVKLLAAGGGGSRVAQDPVAAREVVTLCACLPLAVCLAAAQLAVRPNRSVSALAASLSQGQGSLDALRIDGEAVVRTALDLSYELLPHDSATLYRRMGLLPTDRYDLFLLTASTADNTTTAEAVELALDALLEANLLEETGSGVYRFHDLVRPHARRLGTAEESVARYEHTLRRYVAWCLATASEAETILTPSHRMPISDYASDSPDAPAVVPTPLAGPAEALDWLDTHRDGLMGAVRHCADAGWHTACWRLVDVMWPLFLRLRPTDLWIEAHREGLAAARASGSRAGEGRMLTSGAIGLRTAGRYAESADWYTQALEHATYDGDVRQQAQALNGLGHLSLLTSQLDEARGYFENALRLRESIGYLRGAALSRRRLGETALAAGELSTAADYLVRAHAELDAQEEHYEAARALALLGHVLASDGDHEGGTARLREALGMFRGAGARSEHWQARSLEWLGQAAEQRGDGEEAGRCYEAARELYGRQDPADARRVDDRLRHL
ncbi:tetratricopeptide repeat protein [Streptomyces sp. NBC_01317]|uniref:hypothetical protein n=1 Tax=Streptomyces sp. NBC_01317 TaxID=2903822 RepID=UPI002E0F23AB|nr:tetratricopeptide repeat protein [Streptomyces sp. NBC_01317]